MTSPAAALESISPLFIVRSIRDAAAYYRDRLAFRVTLLIPEDDPIFAIVRRVGAQLLLKEIGEGIAPLPNPERHPNARWDAYIETPDPDALAAELEERGVTFAAPLQDWDDGLRGFELRDPDGYFLFFGRPSTA